MIIIRSDKHNPNRPEIWESLVRLRTLTPTKRSKLVNLLNYVNFQLRTNGDEWEDGEIRSIDDLLKIKAE